MGRGENNFIEKKENDSASGKTDESVMAISTGGKNAKKKIKKKIKRKAKNREREASENINVGATLSEHKKADKKVRINVPAHVNGTTSETQSMSPLIPQEHLNTSPPSLNEQKGRPPAEQALVAAETAMAGIKLDDNPIALKDGGWQYEGPVKEFLRNYDEALKLRAEVNDGLRNFEQRLLALLPVFDKLHQLEAQQLQLIFHRKKLNKSKPLLPDKKDGDDLSQVLAHRKMVRDNYRDSFAVYSNSDKQRLFNQALSTALFPHPVMPVVQLSDDVDTIPELHVNSTSTDIKIFTADSKAALFIFIIGLGYAYGSCYALSKVICASGFNNALISGGATALQQGASLGVSAFLLSIIAAISLAISCSLFMAALMFVYQKEYMKASICMFLAIAFAAPILFTWPIALMIIGAAAVLLCLVKLSRVCANSPTQNTASDKELMENVPSSLGNVPAKSTEPLCPGELNVAHQDAVIAPNSLARPKLQSIDKLPSSGLNGATTANGQVNQDQDQDQVEVEEEENAERSDVNATDTLNQHAQGKMAAPPGPSSFWNGRRRSSASAPSSPAQPLLGGEGIGFDEGSFRQKC